MIKLLKQYHNLYYHYIISFLVLWFLFYYMIMYIVWSVSLITNNTTSLGIKWSIFSYCETAAIARDNAYSHYIWCIVIKIAPWCTIELLALQLSLRICQWYGEKTIILLNYSILKDFPKTAHLWYIYCNQFT